MTTTACSRRLPQPTAPSTCPTCDGTRACNRRRGSGDANDRDAAIRVRAYERYLARGTDSGSPLDDWLTAERELERELWSPEARA